MSADDRVAKGSYMIHSSTCSFRKSKKTEGDTIEERDPLRKMDDKIVVYMGMIGVRW